MSGDGKKENEKEEEGEGERRRRRRGRVGGVEERGLIPEQWLLIDSTLNLPQCRSVRLRESVQYSAVIILKKEKKIRS